MVRAPRCSTPAWLGALFPGPEAQGSSPLKRDVEPCPGDLIFRIRGRDEKVWLAHLSHLFHRSHTGHGEWPGYGSGWGAKGALRESCPRPRGESPRGGRPRGETIFFISDRPTRGQGLDSRENDMTKTEVGDAEMRKLKIGPKDQSAGGFPAQNGTWHLRQRPLGRRRIQYSHIAARPSALKHRCRPNAGPFDGARLGLGLGRH